MKIYEVLSGISTALILFGLVMLTLVFGIWAFGDDSWQSYMMMGNLSFSLLWVGLILTSWSVEGQSLRSRLFDTTAWVCIGIFIMGFINFALV